MIDTFEAKYRGVCGDCRDPIEPGQSVHYEHRGPLVHDHCPDDDAFNVRAGETVCQSCFTIHAGECI